MPNVIKPIADSYWVIPDRLLAGKHPGGRTEREIERRLGALLAAGFNAFVDLTQPDELPPYDAYLPAGMHYSRHPIPDHDIPRDPADMTRALAEIDRLLEAGRQVYVHCRAGIGRTGTVIACHLIEQGMNNADALARLNELWKGSDRSDVWPEVPETEDQRNYILDWTPAVDPTRAPAVMSAARQLRERFHGALVGLAVGDALAVHTQLRKPGTFPSVGDMLGGGTLDLPRGAWTDDTAMTLTLAESLLSRDGFDARDQVERYVQWQRNGKNTSTGQCVGITASVARALSTAQYKRQPFAGSHDPEQRDKDPLSRVAATALFYFADGANAVAQAAESARITAQAPTVLDCVRLLAAIVNQALAGKPKGAVLKPSLDLWVTANTRPEVLAVHDGSYLRREPPDISGGGHVVHALEAALWAFHRSANFRDGALLAANLGQDSDVVASVYGQIAGSHYGLSAIPGNWRNSLMRQDLIADTADRLLAHALVTLGS